MNRIFSLLAIALALYVGSASAQTPSPRALQGYIETALAQNPEVQASRARLHNSEAHVTEATSYLYPRLDFTSKFSQYSGGRVLNIPGVGVFNTAALGVVPWDNSFTVSWPIANLAVWQGMSISQGFRDATTAEVSAKELAISYEVSEAYYNFAKANELVSVRKSAESLAEENRKVANALFAADKAPKNDVLRAEVGVASAEGDVLTAQNMAALAQTRFNNLLKREYDATIETPTAEEITMTAGATADLALKGMHAANPLSLPPQHEDEQRAFGNRPELQQILRTGDALGATKRAAFSDYLPNISLFASYGWQEIDLKFANESHLFVGGAQLKWNLFSGFNSNAKMQEADAQIEELRFNAESAFAGIRLEIQNARLEKINATERFAIAKKLITSAEENYRITKAQYDIGLVPLITMIDAQTTLANAKANLATTTFDVMIGDAKYRKALGLR
ncbi:MAG: TolC family protein [Ignavibacteriota bacterium]